MITSTNEVSAFNYVLAYPNPVSSSITFVGAEGATEIQIANTVGNILATQALSGSTNELLLDIYGLASGSHITKISNGSGVFTKTFVKN